MLQIEVEQFLLDCPERDFWECRPHSFSKSDQTTAKKFLKFWAEINISDCLPQGKVIPRQSVLVAKLMWKNMQLQTECLWDKLFTYS